MNEGLHSADAPGADLSSLLSAEGLEPLTKSQLAKFDAYLELILKWNERMNLTAVRDAAGIVRRHFAESIACAQFLPEGLGSLLDLGSGAGFPGIPIAVCKPQITVTLAESQARKAAFLQEAVRTLSLNCCVWAGRAEALDSQFDCVALRAVDRMERAVASAAELLRVGGWLAILTTEADLPQFKLVAGFGFHWSTAIRLPGSDQRMLGLGVKVFSTE